MEKQKTAAYICRGCDIGKCVDVEALSRIVQESGVENCRVHDCFCAEEGLELIRKDVKDGFQAQVVAACSPRFLADTFLFDGCHTERVNLREHVIWSHEPNDEDTQALAEDYLRMGLARAEKTEMPEPFKEEISQTVLVVGGGHTGITAAIEAAKAGREVVLVEKEEKLGGWLSKFGKSFPKKPPYRDLQENDIEDRIKQVENDAKIRVFTKAKIESIKGQPGQFDVKLRSNGTTEEFRAGAIIQATGWRPYEPSKLSHLGYGSSPNVITNVQMEDMCRESRITRPSDGRKPGSVLFIQCAGSRDPDHLPYCSAVCCRVSLKQALQVRETNPDAKVYVIYKDIRSPGQFEDFYRRVQENPGIFFTKGEVSDVRAKGDKTLAVEVDDTLLGGKVRIEADVVVLATGMVPVSADGENIRKFVDAQAVVAKGEEGAQLEMAKKTVEELKHLEGTEILNLNYRQGPDLPVLRHNMPDSHFICFPYETRRTGIYTAGCMRAPNDTDACRDDATGAALKAVQCLGLSTQGRAVHPRWGDTTYPDLFLQRCTQCKRCTEECPFGTLDEDEKGTPQPNPTRCRRCGICLGACPERIVSFKNYSIDIISSAIKAVEIPDETEEKPRMLAFICENDAYPALDRAGLKRIRWNAHIRFIPVRCLGSVNVVWIADALSSGFDGILLVGCKSGDDYQCHYIRGSELMGTRGHNVQEKLKQLALEEERVRVEEVEITDYEKLPAIVNEFAEQIGEVGLNPFKGF
ncbi:MAG: hydrogenase iron-sulfur subunit [Planctomycetota bacterium]